MTASIAALLPSGVDRSATTSQSRRSIPITRLPSDLSRAAVAAPIPEADPVTTMVRFGAVIGRSGARYQRRSTRPDVRHLPAGRFAALGTSAHPDLADR